MGGRSAGVSVTIAWRIKARVETEKGKDSYAKSQWQQPARRGKSSDGRARQKPVARAGRTLAGNGSALAGAHGRGCGAGAWPGFSGGAADAEAGNRAGAAEQP